MSLQLHSCQENNAQAESKIGTKTAENKVYNWIQRD